MNRSNGNGRTNSPGETKNSNWPLISFNENEDLKMLSNLMNQLSTVLESNRETANELCQMADRLELDSNEDQVKQADDNEHEDYDDDCDTLDGNELLIEENESLKRQIATEKVKLQAGMKFLNVCMYSIETCLTKLRGYIYDRTKNTLNIHAKYVEQIDNESDRVIALMEEQAELEDKLYELSSKLERVVRVANEPENIEQSVDYHLGLRSILQTESLTGNNKDS